MNKLLRFSAGNLVRVFVGVSLLTLGLFGTALWLAWTGSIDTNRAKVLESDARRMIQIHAHAGISGLATAVDVQVGDRFGERVNQIMLLTDPQYRRLAGNLPAWPRELTGIEAIQNVDLKVDGQPIDAALLPHTLPGGYHLLVGRDVRRFERLENLFVFGISAMAAIMSLLGVGGGWLMRRSLLAQVQDINQATQAIMEGDLSHRLPERSGEHELNVLVATENRMLDQIENLVEGVRNVSNSIAHDLRTPLSELRARLEELSVTRPGPGQVFAEIEAAIADVDRVIGIFNALLRMAEIDTGVRRAGFAEADAAGIAAEAVEFYQPLAELKHITLDFRPEGPLTIRCDALLLAQAVGNLIDNALKYAGAGARIEVRAAWAEGRAAISVGDDGPGIADAEKPRVLERFYRGDASRATPGAGLGLSLVATVARLHGGALVLEDRHPGLLATLDLPADINKL